MRVFCTFSLAKASPCAPLGSSNHSPGVLKALLSPYFMVVYATRPKNLHTSRIKCLLWVSGGQIDSKSDVPLVQNARVKKNVRPSRTKLPVWVLQGSKMDVLLRRGERAHRFPSRNAMVLSPYGVEMVIPLRSGERDFFFQR